MHTGAINAENISCKTFNLKVNTSNIVLKQLSATENVLIKSNTGNVCGKLSSNTDFVCKTNTGKVKVPKIAIGGIVSVRCEIKTNTGNMKFE